MLRRAGSHIGLADSPELLLKGMLLCQTSLALLAGRAIFVGSLLRPGDRLLINGFDLFGPAPERLVVRELLFELMHITQEVNPAALMKPLMDVVPGVEITSQHALIVLANQVFDHFSPTGVMIFIIPDAGCGNTPDIAVDA